MPMIAVFIQAGEKQQNSASCARQIVLSHIKLMSLLVENLATTPQCCPTSPLFEKQEDAVNCGTGWCILSIVALATHKLACQETR